MHSYFKNGSTEFGSIRRLLAAAIGLSVSYKLYFDSSQTVEAFSFLPLVKGRINMGVRVGSAKRQLCINYREA
jgi:hypothetical protein